MEKQQYINPIYLKDGKWTCNNISADLNDIQQQRLIQYIKNEIEQQLK